VKAFKPVEQLRQVQVELNAAQLTGAGTVVGLARVAHATQTGGGQAVFSHFEPKKQVVMVGCGVFVELEHPIATLQTVVGAALAQQ